MQTHTHTHTYTHLVGLRWTSDRLGAETSLNLTTQTLTRNVYAPGGIRIRNPSKRAAADPNLDCAPIGTGEAFSFETRVA